MTKQELSIGQEYTIKVYDDGQTHMKYVGKEPNEFGAEPRHAFAKPLSGNHSYRVMLIPDEAIFQLKDMNFVAEDMNFGFREFQLRPEPELDPRSSSKSLLDQIKTFY